MKKIFKKILNLYKPYNVSIKPFNNWSDIGNWNDFDNIGKTMNFTQKLM